MLASSLRIIPGVGFVQSTKIGGLRGYGVIGVCEVGGLCEIEDTGAASFARKRRMGDVFNLQRQGHVAFRVRLHEVVEAEKVVDLLKREGRENIIIEVDGNITPENGRKLREIGASRFVAGTSSIFKGDINKYNESIEKFRRYII